MPYSCCVLKPGNYRESPLTVAYNGKELAFVKTMPPRQNVGDAMDAAGFLPDKPLRREVLFRSGYRPTGCFAP